MNVPTVSSAGDTFLYISIFLLYKSNQDLNVFKKTLLKSTFIETIKSEKSNIIIGIIFKHLSIDFDVFDDSFLNKFLQKVSAEQK